MIGAYILITLGAAIGALTIPLGKRIPDGVMRAITVFGGAFLLAVCCLELLPELGTDAAKPSLPTVAILVGFLVQQVLDSLSAHAEHGHTEQGFTFGGLMVGLCLHALLEGAPLVWQGQVAWGLVWGIVIHNIPVALIVVSVAVAHGRSFWQTLLFLLLFGAMSPLGSIASTYLLQPTAAMQQAITGLVVGVILHVSSSILFDHKRNYFSWGNVGLMAAAFAVATLIIHM